MATTLTSASIEARVVRVGGEEREVAALPAQHLPPELVRGVGERVPRLRVHHVPGALRDLVLELALAPARVAREDPQAGDAAGDDLRRGVEVDEPERAEDPPDADRPRRR